jgi:HD-like signal output (HDOD) protein
MAELAEFFQSAQLPVMSEVAHALVRTLEDDRASVLDVRHIIAKDPALTANLLKLANSAMFGLRHSVYSLDEAIAMAGMSQVRMMAISTCVVGAFPMVPGLSRTEFWRYSMACAGYAQWLAGGVGMDKQAAWLTGLMLRLGEILMSQRAPELMMRVRTMPCAPGERWEREHRMLGFTEGHMTAELVRYWRFPAPMVAALLNAAYPMKAMPFNELGSVVHLAGLLAESPNAGSDELDALPQDVLQQLKLSPEWLHSRLPDPKKFMDVTGL